MKFLTMHKHDAISESGALPSPELIAAMGKLVGGMAQTGQLIDGAGLGPTATRSRVTFKRGDRTVTHGPFGASDNELPAGMAMVTVKSRDEAIEHATKIGRAVGGDVEIEVGKVNEPWDLGMMPKPANAPERYLLIHKATPSTEAGNAPELAAAHKEIGASLVSSASLTPSRFGKRMTWRAGKQRVIDGPFTESKEMIGGYAILEMASWDELLAFCETYSKILLTGTDTLEIDVRPLA